MEVAGAQRPHAAQQISQWPSECMRNKKDETAADHDCGQAQKKHVAIQFIQEFCGLIVGGHHGEKHRGILRIGKLQGSGEVAFAANLDIMRFGLRRSANERANVVDRELVLPQRRRDQFIAAGDCDVTASYLTHFCGQTMVDLVSDHQESEHGSIGAGPAVHRLNKSLIKMMLAKPPVAGHVAILQRLLEVLLGSLAAKARSLRMNRKDFA